jgi:GNAT superfamily N-acetyltransferase
MSDIELKWRVEEACLNAWPSPRQLFLHGWILRFSGGSTRRTNSVNPMRWDRRDAPGIIAAAETLYGSLGRNTIFRLPDMAADIDEALNRRGYVFDEDVATLIADPVTMPRLVPSDAVLSEAPDEAWLAMRQRTAGMGDADFAVYRQMLDILVLPRRFASISEGNAVCSIAYGAIHDRLLVIESVATLPAFRKRGLGARTVGALLAWGCDEGIEAACLQVVADNQPARALYDRLGFTRDLYHYHYRHAPVSAR